MSLISRTEYKYCLSQSANVAILTGAKSPPQKKAKLSETDHNSRLFLLSLVTRFACDTGQLAKIWI